MWPLEDKVTVVAKGWSPRPEKQRRNLPAERRMQAKGDGKKYASRFPRSSKTADPVTEN